MPIFKGSTARSEADKKFCELVLYISEKSAGDAAFGATKLNKLLFYADFLAYLNFGEAISGQEYFRLPNGPAPRKMIPLRRSMVEAGEILLQKAEFCGFPQDRIVPLRPARKDDFAPHEIALVDKVIELHKGKTASEISDESHDFVGWSLAEDKETIPYEVARIMTTHELTDAEFQHGKTLAAEASILAIA